MTEEYILKGVAQCSFKSKRRINVFVINKHTHTNTPQVARGDAGVNEADEW